MASWWKAVGIKYQQLLISCKQKRQQAYCCYKFNILGPVPTKTKWQGDEEDLAIQQKFVLTQYYLIFRTHLWRCIHISNFGLYPQTALYMNKKAEMEMVQRTDALHLLMNKTCSPRLSLNNRCGNFGKSNLTWILPLVLNLFLVLVPDMLLNITFRN